MKIPHPVFAVTPYGDVDAATLATLCAEFGTGELLNHVTTLESLTARFATRGGVRDELLRLHRMASAVINGALVSEPAGADDLCELARDLCDELDDWAERLQEVTAAVRPLARLQPDCEP